MQNSVSSLIIMLFAVMCIVLCIQYRVIRNLKSKHEQWKNSAISEYEHREAELKVQCESRISAMKKECDARVLAERTKIENQKTVLSSMPEKELLVSAMLGLASIQERLDRVESNANIQNAVEARIAELVNRMDKAVDIVSDTRDYVECLDTGKSELSDISNKLDEMHSELTNLESKMHALESGLSSIGDNVNTLQWRSTYE